MKNTSKGIVAGSGDSFTQPVARTPSQIAVLRRTIPCRTILETPSCPQELKKGAIGWSMEGLKVQRVLGEGALSTVVQATCNLTGLAMALKIYHRDRLNSLNVRQISREIEIHASVTHPNVIKLYAAFEDADGIYLVQEFAAGGDLYAELARHGGHMIEAYVIKAVMAPFLQVLTHLHERGVLHRDIKPENILLTDQGEIKVADFGLAIDTTREKPMSRVGTLDYMPPEIAKLPRPGAVLPASTPGSPKSPVVRCAPSPSPSRFATPPPTTSCSAADTSLSPKPQPQEHSSATASVVGTPRSPAPLDVTRESFREQAYGLPADIWCTGVLAYELLVGGAPFEAQTKEETYARILNIQPFYPDCFSREAIHFMKLALEKDPDRRPTAPQLLAHPWLRGSISGRSVHASPTAGIVLATSSHGVDRGLSPTTTSSGGVKSRNNVVISAYLTQLQKARPAPSTAATTTASVATTGTVPCETTPTAAEGPSVVTPLNKATAGPEIPTNFERVKESSKALVPHPDQSVSPADGDTGELIAASYGSEDSTPNQALAVLAMLKHGSPGGIKRTKSRFLADCMKKLGLSALVSKVGRPMSRGGDKGEATPDTVNGRRNSPLGLSR